MVTSRERSITVYFHYFQKISILDVARILDPVIDVAYSTILEFLVFKYSRVGILIICRDSRKFYLNIFLFSFSIFYFT